MQIASGLFFHTLRRAPPLKPVASSLVLLGNCGSIHNSIAKENVKRILPQFDAWKDVRWILGPAEMARPSTMTQQEKQEEWVDFLSRSSHIQVLDGSHRNSTLGFPLQGPSLQEDDRERFEQDWKLAPQRWMFLTVGTPFHPQFGPREAWIPMEVQEMLLRKPPRIWASGGTSLNLSGFLPAPLETTFFASNVQKLHPKGPVLPGYRPDWVLSRKI